MVFDTDAGLHLYYLMKFTPEAFNDFLAPFVRKPRGFFKEKA